jgi:hypothetical protein
VEATELVARTVQAAEREAKAMEDLAKLTETYARAAIGEAVLLRGYVEDLRQEVKGLGARLERVLEASHD